MAEKCLAMKDGKKFPENFIWGTATSSYQIEGAFDVDGKGLSVWDTHSHTMGKIKNQDNGDRACNHYFLWKEDFKLLKDLGVNAYRFSTSWTRIFPRGTETKPNMLGLDFYSRIVDSLLENDISPFLTINHWDIPQGIEDLGGWPNRNVIDHYLHYAYWLSKHLGDRVKNWITHNEPWCISYKGYIEGEFPPGIKNNWTKSIATTHHLLLSHGMAIPEIKSNSLSANVGITLNLTPGIPASSSEYDIDECAKFDGVFNRMYLDPLYKKSYPQDIFDWLLKDNLIKKSDLEIIFDNDLKTISTETDFLGVNYYSRAIVRNKKVPKEKNLPVEIKTGNKTDFGWEIHPDSFYKLLIRIKNDYSLKKIYITENGCSYKIGPDKNKIINDNKRIEYHNTHLLSLKKAIDSGVPCEGYFAWSLLDNFEWCEGFGQRFGLVWVDFDSLERIPKNSFFWYRDLILRNGG
mgnify:CR=1 FL=1